MQIRKNTLFILIILVALLLVVGVCIFFNRRIHEIENKGQPPHSEIIDKNPSINIKSTSRL